MSHHPTGHPHDPAQPPSAQAGEIDVTALHDVLGRADGVARTVVDVREDHEFADGHVPGAVPVPLSGLVERVQEILDLPGEVYLVCESGGRSGQVAAWLAQQGHVTTNVVGGTSAWRRAGYPVE